MPPRQRHAHRRINPCIKVDVAIGMLQCVQDGEVPSVCANPAKSVRVGRLRRPGGRRRNCDIPILQAALPQLHPCIGRVDKRRWFNSCFLVHRQLHTSVVDNVHPGGSRPADRRQSSNHSISGSCTRLRRRVLELVLNLNCRPAWERSKPNKSYISLLIG